METDGLVLDERHFPGRQGRLLFAYLVTEHARSVPRHELAEVLWKDTPPATWDKALSVLVSKLRVVLAESRVGSATALTAPFGCYRLDLWEGVWVDVLEAEKAVLDAEALLGRHEWDKAAAAAALAESLLRLPLLPGEDGSWVQTKRRELADLRARALRVLAEAYLHSGNASESVRWAEQLLEVEPFRENGYRLLMASHIAAGNRAEALGVYERCRQLLADELGTYPSPETESIYRGLLETPSRRATAGAPSQPGTAPRRTNRRRRLAIALATLVIAGVVSAAIALANRSGSPFHVLPNSVIRIDPMTMKVTQVAAVGDAPDLVIASGGYLWVTNNVLRDTDSSAIRNAGDRTLTRVDPVTGKAVPVGGGLAPCAVTADPSGDVWVANCFTPGSGQTSNLVRVNATTLAFKQTLSVPGGGSFYRGLAYGGGFLWVSNVPSPGSASTVNTITRIDPRSGAVRTIPVGSPPGALGWSEGYGDLWITNFVDGSLTRLHAATGTTQTIGSAATNPASVVVDGSVVWVADWSAPHVVRLNAIGPVRPRLVALPVRNTAACAKYSCVWTVAAGTDAIWATTPRDRALWRIDPKTNAVTRVALPYPPTGVTADANGVWVTLRAH